MKNLLVIAYYFPPSGGPGVQRVLKHIKYLPAFGWNPIVLTVSNGDFPARDESLLKQIPDNIEVIRTKIFEPYDLYRLLTGKDKSTAIDVNVIKKEGEKIGFKETVAEFIRSTFFIPDARIAWYFTAKSAIEEIIKTKNISAVYSSSPPYTCSLIARHVKRKYGIPWIAGFRDPWTGFISSPKRWLLPRIIDESMEKSVFTECDAVECAWEGIIKDALNKYPNLNKDKFHHIPNGFDSTDFPQVELAPNDKFTITYTGSMYGRRNPASLFAAIEKLIQAGEVDVTKIRLRFIGRFGNEVIEMFDKASFKSNIEVISYMAHSESIGNLMMSDCLLLVVDESKESKEIVPGKVYEYIGVGKAILAIGPPDGAVGKLILQTKAGSIAHQSEINLIAKNLKSLYTKWLNNIDIYIPDQDIISLYERKNAAKDLSSILDSLIAK